METTRNTLRAAMAALSAMAVALAVCDKGNRFYFKINYLLNFYSICFIYIFSKHLPLKIIRRNTDRDYL